MLFFFLSIFRAETHVEYVDGGRNDDVSNFEDVGSTTTEVVKIVPDSGIATEIIKKIPEKVPDSVKVVPDTTKIVSDSAVKPLEECYPTKNSSPFSHLTPQNQKILLDGVKSYYRNKAYTQAMECDDPRNLYLRSEQKETPAFSYKSKKTECEPIVLPTATWNPIKLSNDVAFKHPSTPAVSVTEKTVSEPKSVSGELKVSVDNISPVMLADRLAGKLMDQMLESKSKTNIIMKNECLSNEDLIIKRMKDTIDQRTKEANAPVPSKFVKGVC